MTAPATSPSYCPRQHRDPTPSGPCRPLDGTRICRRFGPPFSRGHMRPRMSGRARSNITALPRDRSSGGYMSFRTGSRGRPDRRPLCSDKPPSRKRTFSGHRGVGERKAMGTATGSSTLNSRWALLGSASRYSRGSCEGGVSRLQKPLRARERDPQQARRHPQP